MNNDPRSFKDDYEYSEKNSNSVEVKQLYEKKLNAKIIEREKIVDKKQQKSGYDVILKLDDGRVLTIEEKFRQTFYPDILLEINHIFGKKKKIGWLYKTQSEILAYFQHKNNGLMLTLWKLKELARWSKSKEFLELLNEETIKEKWSSTKEGDVFWKTKNYGVPFYVLKNKGFEYKKNNGNELPLEFY